MLSRRAREDPVVRPGLLHMGTCVRPHRAARAKHLGGRARWQYDDAIGGSRSAAHRPERGPGYLVCIRLVWKLIPDGAVDDGPENM
jgi:hypothetical protein